MKPPIQIDPWSVIETSWNPEAHIMSESLFALGNGRMGHRANHEEAFSGKHLQGSYVAGLVSLSTLLAMVGLPTALWALETLR